MPRRDCPDCAPSRRISTPSCGRCWPARRQLEEAPAIRPRRTRDDRRARAGAHADLGRAARIHLVHPRRLLRAQPAQGQRRRRSREAERRKYEADYLQRVQERDKRRARRQRRGRRGRRTGGARPGQPATSRPRDVDGLIADAAAGVHFVGVFPALQVRGRQIRARRPRDARRPRRAAHRVLPGEAVRRHRAPPRKAGEKSRTRRRATREFQRLMNKVALVTLWVEPKAHQIVKYTFDNVRFDFLPASGSCTSTTCKRVDDDGAAVSGRVAAARRSNSMSALTLAVGQFDLRYALDYHDYRRPDVTSKVGVKNADDVAALLVAARAVRCTLTSRGRSGPRDVTAIQIQGNTVDERRRGSAPRRCARRHAARSRTPSTKWRRGCARRTVRSVEVLKALRVDRRPVADRAGDHRRRRAGAHREDRRSRSADARRPQPPAEHDVSAAAHVEDGYGLTYGARFAAGGSAGRNSRLSFPLTWGGDKEAAAELDKTFVRGPINRVIAGASISRRDQSVLRARTTTAARVWVRGERELDPCGPRRGRRPAGSTSRSSRRDDRFAQAGADVVLDTRLDPLLPRNAVYARAAGSISISSRGRRQPDRARCARLHGTVRPEHARRACAAPGLPDRPLPPYLKPLLGGMANLRGFGRNAAGDTLVAGVRRADGAAHLAAQRRQDRRQRLRRRGTVYDKGERFADQTMKRGIWRELWFRRRSCG